MCKDFKTTQFERSKERTISQQQRSRLRSSSRQDIEEYVYTVDTTLTRPTSFDIPLSNFYGNNTQRNLKFVLYIYEVKKMRDIYGRVTSALDIIKQKR